MEMKLHEKLIAIQNELNVSKTRKIKYAGREFYYRNAEDILEAVKPLCQKYKLLIYVTTKVIYQDAAVYEKETYDTSTNIRNRLNIRGACYIEATAIALDETGMIQASAPAKEEFENKSMNTSQRTGSANSYSKKYALENLLNLNDIRDADELAGDQHV